MKKAVFSLACLLSMTGLLTAHQSSPSPAPFWGDLSPGSYSVGYEVFYERDTTRRWLTGKTAKDIGRPIRISVWYPAVDASGQAAMQYGDYFHFDGPASFKALDDQLEKDDRESWLRDLVDVSSPEKGRELMERMCATPTVAHPSAKIAHGHFPLVLYASGQDSRADANVELGEFLASHGYIVVTVPQLGANEDDLELEGTAADVEVHLKDLEYALNFMRNRREVDASKLAIIGHSIGGTLSLYFAMQHPETSAAVSLDGSFGFTDRSKLFRAYPRYAPDKIRAPILDLRREQGVQEASLDPTVLGAAVNSKRYQVRFKKMFHGDFTEFGTIGLKLPAPLPPNDDGRTRQTGYDGNQTAYRGVLAFLDAKLRGNAKSLDRWFAQIRSQSDLTVGIYK
jgi:dienelactone hydrolase